MLTNLQADPISAYNNFSISTSLRTFLKSCRNQGQKESLLVVMKALQKQQQDTSSLSTARLPTSRPSTAQGFSLPIRQVHSYGDCARIRTAREDRTDRSSRSSKTGIITVSEPAIFITPEIEEAVKEWVASLGLSHCLPQPKLPFTQDPFRNGILACELAQVLEKRPVEGSVLAPVTTTEIARNFEKALKAIQKAHPPAFNPAYYSLAPRLARGSDDTLWGFYWALYNAYPLVLPPHLEQVAHELPYDSVGIRRLEATLLGWMTSLGVLVDYEVPGSLIDLIPRMRTGYLICEVVRKALFVEIEEVFSAPRSEGAVLSNIRKALEVLKKYPEMSQKFVWSREKDISKGNLGVIMGLLEDIYRCQDGLPVRRPGPTYHSDGPYCGPPAPIPLPKSEKTYKEETFGKPPGWIQTGNASEAVLPSPKNFTLGQSSLAPVDIIPSPKRNVMISFQEEIEEAAEIDLPQFDTDIKRWLASLGIATYAEGYFGGKNINEARDGVLLCELIETLERTKLAGTNKCPRTAAGCRQNMRKALEFLRSKPTFPMGLYYVEEELLRGEGKTWRKVLVEVQRIYKYAAKTRRK